MDEYREQNGVPDEENRSVVPHKVPDTIFCIEFYGESTGIPVSIIICYGRGKIFILNSYQIVVIFIIKCSGVSYKQNKS
jgi:hypothetical protein